jgi:BASS family bile acid:Na+ symporter
VADDGREQRSRGARAITTEQILDHAFDVGVAVAIVATVASLGLSLTISEVVAPLRRVGLVIGLVAVNVVVIPLAAWGLSVSFGLSDDAVSGVTLAAIGSAGAAGLKASQLSGRADLALAVSMVIVLQVLNLVAVPLWAGQVVSGATISPVTILQNLIVLVLVPLLVGLSIRGRSEVMASRWRPILVRIANLSLVIALGAGIAVNWGSIVELAGSRVMVVSVVIVVFAVASGMLVGGRDPATRAAAGLVSGMRFAALGLVIIASQLDGVASVLGPAIVYALIDIVVAVAIALAMARGWSVGEVERA